MSGAVAFYAPLKPPDHPIPSGDRRMARALLAALAHAGRPVELASRLRSYDRGGDPLRQRRLATLGARCAARLLRRYERRPPAAWLTYHAYHKSPDWLGPAVAGSLGIPYLIAEASFAPKQAAGPWAAGHAASERAIRQADVVLAMTARDAPCLAPLVAPPAELRPLPPFLDPAPFQAAHAARARHRAALAGRFGLDPGQPWLLAVAMMRQDVKLLSYRLLGAALRAVTAPGWQLLVVGDGPARAEVEACLVRARFAGAVAEEALPAFYAAADLMVWPAVREAYGLALLEAQAAGLPVVAGREGGVEEVVRDGVTGLLTPPREPAAFARAVDELLRAARAAACDGCRRAALRRRRARSRAGRGHARCGARRGGGHPGGAAMTRLLLLRHGLTAWNDSRRMQGRADLALSAAGRAEVLRWRLPAGWEGACWLTSPLRRARETAALLTAGPVVVEPRLIEMDWGAWEGRSRAELQAAAGEELAAQEALGLDLRPPRGESPREVCARLSQLVAELDALPAPVVAVSHNGVIRAALALATGWDMRSAPPLRLQRDQALALLCRPGGDLELQPPPLPLVA